MTRHVTKLRDLLLSDFLKTLLKMQEIAFRDTTNPKFSHRLFEDEFWGKCRPRMSDDYDFITSARDDASSWRQKWRIS